MACPTCVRSAQRRVSHHGGAERDSQGASPSQRSGTRVFLEIHLILLLFIYYLRITCRIQSSDAALNLNKIADGHRDASKKKNPSS